VRPTLQLLIVNFTCVAFSLAYLSIFLVYNKLPNRLKIAQRIAAVAAFVAVFYIALFAAPMPYAADIAGTVTVVVNLSFFVSPLRQLVRICA
jgi:hypothetical protein